MNDTVVVEAVVLGDVTSYETYYLTALIFIRYIQPPVYLLGLSANLINILVYLKIGLRDCINICFFVLSCADLIGVMLLTAEEFCAFLNDVLRDVWRIDSKSLLFLVAFYYGAVYDISQGITTFIAVQKCWCVALPFRFKDTFTTGRTTVILTVITISVFSMHLPVLTTQALQEIPVNNSTLLILWTAEIRKQLFPLVGLISLIFTNACQFTVIFCVFILASSLRASSKFRNSSTVLKQEQPTITKTTSNFKTDESNSGDKSSHKTARKKRMTWQWTATKGQVDEKHPTGRSEVTPMARQVKPTSTKELQAIQSTTFVSIVFVTCNTFKLLNYYVILCIPDFSLYGRFANTYFLYSSYRLFLESVHISCNIFIYLRFNTRFRSTLVSSCGRCYLQLTACFCRFTFK